MNRAGLVLVVVLLAVLALELLAMSAFGFARVAQLGARIALADAQLQAAADDAVEQAAANVDGRAVAAMAVGTQWSEPAAPPTGTEAAVMLRRLAGGLVVVQAHLTSSRGGGVARAAAVVRVIEPAAVLAAFPAVLSVFGFVGATPDVIAPAQVECTLDHDVAPAALPLTHTRALIDSLPLGALVGAGWADVAAIADSRELPADTLPSLPRMLALPAPLTLIDTVAGILSVDGDLVLASGALVRGLVTVNGTLTLGDGARIDGAARAAAVIDEGGRVAYDRCAIELALTAPVFDRAYRPGRRWRLPAF